MKIVIFVLATAAAMVTSGAPAQAQNYPWCLYWNSNGGARNCGFISFPQCMQSAMGAGASCMANPGYEPNKPMR